MNTDPIADFLTRIRNGYMAKKIVVTAPYSQIKEKIGHVLKKYGFIEDIKVEEDNKRKVLTVYLKYEKNTPAIAKIKRVSKPGTRFYVRAKNLHKIRGGFGIAILTTSQGIMSGEEARKKKIGGEVLCYVW